MFFREMKETREISKKSLILLSFTIVTIITLSVFIPMFYCANAGCGEINSDSEYTDITVEEAYNMINDDVNYPDLIILQRGQSGANRAERGRPVCSSWAGDRSPGRACGWRPRAGAHSRCRRTS